MMGLKIIKQLIFAKYHRDLFTGFLKKKNIEISMNDYIIMIHVAAVFRITKIIYHP